MTGESRRHRRERGGVTDSIGERERDHRERSYRREANLHTRDRLQRKESDTKEKRVLGRVDSTEERERSQRRGVKRKDQITHQIDRL